MTEDQIPDPELDEVERRDYAALIDFLANTLDVRGGLAEAIDVARYTTMRSHLADLLDLEAGLRSALRTAHAEDKRPGGLARVPHIDHEEFARRWAEAIIDTSYVAVGCGGLAEKLLGLTQQLVAAVLAVEFDPSVGHRVGVEMVAAHLTGTETLSRTLAVMVEGLPGVLGSVPPGLDVAGRVTQLAGNVAAGYAGALRERSLDEQDAIYRAGLRALRQAETRFRAVFTEAAIGIGIADRENNIIDANPALQRMFGYTLEEFTQRNVREMVHPEDAPSLWEYHDELIRGERDHFRMEKRFYRCDGEEIWTDLTVSLVRDEAGEPDYQVALVEDVSERHHLQVKLVYDALHDPLTGLANRRKVGERLDQIFGAPVGRRRVGLCFLDLDGFKRINDSLGHDVGDELLKAVASRLTRCCGSGQLVARMGGDEFVIIIEDTAGEHDMRVLADEILASMEAPIRVRGHELTVTTSIGVIERLVADTTPADLLQAADITMYQAKTGGKARYAMFDRDRNDREVTRNTLSNMLPGAVERGEFFLEYQPLVCLKDGVLRGVEALVRWRHPTLGVLEPERFIDLAEETGSIVQLGHWVLAQACAQARKWQDDFDNAAPFVSVNLAPRQLYETTLVDDVTAILADNGLHPSSLRLELTEQELMGEQTGPLKVLTKLHNIGVHIALDDFGAGYWNIPDLVRLPLHELKLARSFAAGLRPDEPDPRNPRIVAALVELAHAMDLPVTAEGIETQTQLERFRSAGCDVGQGLLFGAPSSPEQIDALLRAGLPLSAVATDSG